MDSPKTRAKNELAEKARLRAIEENLAMKYAMINKYNKDVKDQDRI